MELLSKGLRACAVLVAWESSSKTQVIPVNRRVSDDETALEFVSRIAKPMGGRVRTYQGIGIGGFVEAIPVHSYGLSKINAAGISRDFENKAIKFILAHEVAHSKRGDRYWIFATGFITVVASQILLSAFVFPPVALLVSLTAGVIALCAYNRFCERRADREACEQLCNDDINKGIEWMEGVQRKRIDQREKGSCFNQILINQKGEYRLDILNPSLTGRIHQLKAIVKQRATRD